MVWWKKLCMDTEGRAFHPEGWTAEPVAGVRPSVMWMAQRNTVQNDLVFAGI